MYIISIDAIYYRYILVLPNLGNSIFNIKEENDQPEVIGSNYAAENSTQLNRKLI
jgi:hypothetical protein